MGIECIWGDKMTQNIFRCAIAEIRGDSDHPGLRGIVRFFQRDDGVLVEAEVMGLPRTETGFFAFHIHEEKTVTGRASPIPAAILIPAGQCTQIMREICRRCWPIMGRLT